jgi:hypothetical protein
MKRTIAVLGALALFVAAFAGTAVAVVPGSSATTTVDLLADQDIDVGDVTVVNDGSYITVTYTITDLDWCITDTHLQLFVGDPNPDDHSFLTKQGNPSPGQFEYSGSHDCVTEVGYQIPLEEIDDYSEDDDVNVAAHAVVTNLPGKQAFCDEQGYVFGVERGTGDLYEINVPALTAERIFDFTDPTTDNVNSPNGLAWDGTNLWFSLQPVASDDVAFSELWKWDGTNATYEYDVPGLPAGAVIDGGYYYYFINGTDNLVMVDLSDGTPSNAWTDVTGVDDVSLRFGDLVIDGNIMYGSTNGPAENFFSLDLTTGAYTEISAPDGSRLQLAFGGDDGVLYGQSTATGEFFTVNPASGVTTSVGTLTGAIDGFTDLADGDCVPVPDYETAWGAGSLFVQRGSWATYFTHDTQTLVASLEGEGNTLNTGNGNVIALTIYAYEWSDGDITGTYSKTVTDGDSNIVKDEAGDVTGFIYDAAGQYANACGDLDGGGGFGLAVDADSDLSRENPTEIGCTLLYTGPYYADPNGATDPIDFVLTVP